MATISRGGAAPRALVLLLGAAVFLNYVDRGAIAVAAPLMKGELALTNDRVRNSRLGLLLGLCAGAAVRGLAVRPLLGLSLDGAGHCPVGGEHPADGAGRRLCLAARTAHHARHRREHCLSRQLQDHRPPRSAGPARRRQCRRCCRPCARPRGGNACRRTDRCVLGLAGDVYSIRAGDADLAGAVGTRPLAGSPPTIISTMARASPCGR